MSATNSNAARSTSGTANTQSDAASGAVAAEAAHTASGAARTPSDSERPDSKASAAAKAPMPAVSRPRFSPGRAVLTLFLTLLSLLWLIPLAFILINSFKGKLFISESPFALPDGESSVGLNNYTKTLGDENFGQAILWSLFITVASVAVIVFFCAMTAYYITRVKTWWTSVIYYLFAFSMIVPFQMVMFPTSSIADRLGLATPWGMVLLYLGFGGGLSVFLFSGFVKSIPLEIEEASYIDGCSPLQNYFRVVMPLLKPTAVTVAILNTMWVWNDFLLPYLVIGSDERYKTIPIVIQGMIGTNGNKDLGAQMAVLVMAVIPIVVFYLACQKYIVEGVAAGAVKG